jgi:hypothetical protein
VWRLPRPAVAVVAVSLPVEAAAVLTDGEVWRLALRHLALRARQRGANQWPMHPFVLGRVGLGFWVTGSGGFSGLRGFSGGARQGRGFLEECGRRGEILVHRRGIRLGVGIDRGHWRTRTRDGGRIGDERAFRLLSARRRQFRLFVLMIRVARGAACLLHVLFDHGDNHMIRDAALTRTVVVENVTEPNPALLHELPRSDAFRWGGLKSGVKAHLSLADSDQT